MPFGFRQEDFFTFSLYKPFTYNPGSGVVVVCIDS